jgi:alpha-L-fucosidase
MSHYRYMLPLVLLLSLVGNHSVRAQYIPSTANPSIIIDTTKEPISKGKFAANWQSLRQYQVPKWFRDAKFGIWAHWGPQCQPEAGDWYARNMYIQGHRQNQYHVANYGHPSQFGFKDVIHTWKAEKWNPNKLVSLYKRVGAQYFFAMANHHDNLDLWNSKYQPWNSVRVGPQKDIVAGWAKAARSQGLPFGVSVHAAHSWHWYETSQGADKDGPFAGVAYDGKLTKADGVGQWWEGLDPQDIYAQNHPLTTIPNTHQNWWIWGEGVNLPDQAYCEKFYNRTVDLINRYNPDLLYFDDTALPLWPISDAGLKIAAHFYNHNMSTHGGKLEAVLFGKALDEEQRKSLVWDLERSQRDDIEPFVWQTDTCIGDWHYDREFYKDNRYKNAISVIQMLCDIVSKNGNLLLNIPVRGDGSIDEKEEQILEGIATWMKVNKRAIFETRPWKKSSEKCSLGPLEHGAHSEAKVGATIDVRFTSNGKSLYVIALGAPSQAINLTSLGKTVGLLDGKISNIQQLGANERINWTQSESALTIEPAKGKPVSEAAVVFKITAK